jgi:hypothetical protein
MNAQIKCDIIHGDCHPDAGGICVDVSCVDMTKNLFQVVIYLLHIFILF